MYPALRRRRVLAGRGGRRQPTRSYRERPKARPSRPARRAEPGSIPAGRTDPLIRETAAGASAESPGAEGGARTRSVDAVLRPERPERVLLSQCALRISRSHDPGGMAFEAVAKPRMASSDGTAASRRRV